MILGDWLVDWSSPQHIAINVLAGIVWIAAMVDLVRSPRGAWFNRRGAVLMFLVIMFLSVYVAGVFIPVGAIGWFGWWRQHGGLGRLPQGRP